MRRKIILKNTKNPEIYILYPFYRTENEYNSNQGKQNNTITEVHTMFLFWLLIALAIGVGENLKDSYDAYKYNQSGGFYARHPAFKPKPWEQEYLDRNKRKYR